MARRSLDEVERRRVNKPVDAWWTVLVIDPVALRILPLVRDVRWITPTAVTALGGLLGVAAIGLFYAGHHVAGGVAYALRFLLDCIDGKLARLRGTSSAFGALLDVLLDVVLTTVTYAVVAQAAAPRLTALVVGLALFEAWSRERRASVAARRAVTGTSERRTRLAIAPSTVEGETIALVLVPVMAWRYEAAGLGVAVALLALICCDHLRVVVGAAWAQR